MSALTKVERREDARQAYLDVAEPAWKAYLAALRAIGEEP